MRGQDDENARPDVTTLVDATGDDYYALGSDFAAPFGMFTDLDPDTLQPSSKIGAGGIFDPWCTRFHDLQQKTPSGTPDRRFSIQILNDPDGPYNEPADGMAPKQHEEFTALNRSTREMDAKGRVALPCSTRIVVDSADGRHALAHVIGDLDLGGATSPEAEEELPAEGPTGETFPPGVAIKGVGSEGGTGGAVTRSQPSVSIQGVTFFGQGAVEAARQANARGGSAMDIARAASHAARGLAPPPQSVWQGGGPGGAGPTKTRAPSGDDATIARNPTGSVSAAGRPEGYITNRRRHGLLGTFFTTEGTDEAYAICSEGRPLNRAGARHDAHFVMGGDQDITGAIRFVSNPADALPRKGKWVKGEMRPDSTLANQDTEVGQETAKWVPCVPISADIPPSTIPPDGVPGGGVDLGGGAKDGGGGEEDGEDPRDPRTGPRDPKITGAGGAGGAGGGGGKGQEGAPQPPQTKPIGVIAHDTPLTEQQEEAAAENPAPVAAVPDEDDPRDAPVPTADNQRRDFSQPGTPCPNRPGGMLIEENRPDGPRRGETTTGGGQIVTTGFPGVVTDGSGKTTIGGEFTVSFGGGGAFALGLPIVLPLGFKPQDMGGVVVDRRDEAVERGSDERREKAERKRRADERRAKKQKAKDDREKQRRDDARNAKDKAAEDEQRARQDKNREAERRARERRQKAERELERMDARAAKEKAAADAKAAKAKAKAEREDAARQQRAQQRAARDAEARRRLENARERRAKGELPPNLNGASPQGAWIVDDQGRLGGFETQQAADAARAAGDVR